MPSNVVKEGGEKNIESVIIPNRGGGGVPRWWSHPLRFLDALASLVLLIAHWLTHSPIGNWWSSTTLVLTIEIETPASHSKLNVTQNEMSLKMECHSKRNVTQNGMSLYMEFHSIWNVTQNGTSLKMECQWKWNVIQNGMSLKREFYSKWNVIRILKKSPNLKCNLKWNVT